MRFVMLSALAWLLSTGTAYARCANGRCAMPATRFAPAYVRPAPLPGPAATYAVPWYDCPTCRRRGQTRGAPVPRPIPGAVRPRRPASTAPTNTFTY